MCPENPSMALSFLTLCLALSHAAAWMKDTTQFVLHTGTANATLQSAQYQCMRQSGGVSAASQQGKRPYSCQTGNTTLAQPLARPRTPQPSMPSAEVSTSSAATALRS